ncbi:hypothetical protein HK099_007913 [Clydaea vesicula]|uniref:Serine protease n=1 Tax=Clydaea vesicula TaxID=447962 RepID=A0AAD5XTG1_9FUNG|nr:hypothetical protein HK099_007913 [Clydaea vesicula]
MKFCCYMNESSEQLTIEQANSLSVVVIVNQIGPRQTQSTIRVGSSFLLNKTLHSSKRILVTNRHVLEEALKYAGVLQVAAYDGTLISVTGYYHASDLDLCTLILPYHEMLKDGLSIDEGLKNTGTMVHTWGFPRPYMFFAPLLTVGYVSGFHNQQYYLNMGINPGNSGGPLISSGQVIGVIVNKLVDRTDDISKKIQSLKVVGGMLTMSDGEKHVDIASTIAEAFEFTTSTSQLVIGGAITSDLLKKFIDIVLIELDK